MITVDITINPQSSIRTILTTDHPASRGGIPVLLCDGQVYGPADMVPDPEGFDDFFGVTPRTWAEEVYSICERSYIGLYANACAEHEALHRMACKYLAQHPDGPQWTCLCTEPLVTTGKRQGRPPGTTRTQMERVNFRLPAVYKAALAERCEGLGQSESDYLRTLVVQAIGPLKTPPARPGRK